MVPHFSYLQGPEKGAGAGVNVEGQGISGAELARRLGIGESGVRKAFKTGRIKRNDDGTYDPDQAMRQFRNRTRPGQSNPSPSVGAKLPRANSDFKSRPRK